MKLKVEIQKIKIEQKLKLQDVEDLLRCANEDL